MPLIKIPLYDNLKRFIRINSDATEGATLGGDLYYQGRVLDPAEILNPGTDPETPQVAVTIWRYIQEIPANIVKLAALAGAGFATRASDGEWYQRELTVGDRLSVEFGDGQDGDPFIDLADSILTASGTISALRVVVAEDGVARYPDQDDDLDALLAVGVSASAATDGNPVRVQTEGEMIDASWTWTPGVVWCGASGVLTQTIPATGWLMEVGRALDADRIVIGLQTPYIRSV